MIIRVVRTAGFYDDAGGPQPRQGRCCGKDRFRGCEFLAARMIRSVKRTSYRYHPVIHGSRSPDAPTWRSDSVSFSSCASQQVDLRFTAAHPAFGDGKREVGLPVAGCAP
jgi:hypothetical protein